MAANGISTLKWKRDRQIAKLELDSQKRKAQHDLRESLPPEQITGALRTPRFFAFDINLLPSLYAEDSNVTADRIINPVPEGPVRGRPWIEDVFIEFPVSDTKIDEWASRIFTASQYEFEE